jgi:colicin import membrane protein
MIRARENPIAIQAGVLALLVHGLFLFVMIFSFTWKHVQPPAAAEVELWDSLPKPIAVTPPPVPEVKPEPPPPEIKPEPKPEIKPEPPPEPKAEIQLKPKPVEVKKPPKEEPKKPDPALKKQEDEKKRKDQLEKLKKAMLQDVPDQETPPAPAVDTKAQQAQSAADAKRAEEILAASSGVVNEYKARIVAKIKRYVNRQPCGTDKLELVYAIALIPDGHVNGSPRLVKSSGLSACDLAVERAILQAQPLPLPPQTELFDQFRNLNLNFRPNEDQ